MRTRTLVIRMLVFTLLFILVYVTGVISPVFLPTAATRAQSEASALLLSEVEWQAFVSRQIRPTTPPLMTRNTNGVVTTVAGPSFEDQIRLQFLTQQIKASFRSRGAFSVRMSALPAHEAVAIKEILGLLSRPGMVFEGMTIDIGPEARVDFDKNGMHRGDVDFVDRRLSYSF